MTLTAGAAAPKPSSAPSLGLEQLVARARARRADVQRSRRDLRAGGQRSLVPPVTVATV